MRVVVDTNVIAVAQGLSEQASLTCINQCVQRLAQIMNTGCLVVDDNGYIIEEYLRKLGFSGRPGAGRAFAKWVHDNQYNELCCSRVQITIASDGGWRQFDEFPNNQALRLFDADDQKFVAVAMTCADRPPILNAVDSDWWHFRDLLSQLGVTIDFLCPERFHL